ncbi:MAG: hypothetical protein AAFU67_12665, partial [Bacteroidota bacterium]
MTTLLSDPAQKAVIAKAKPLTSLLSNIPDESINGNLSKEAPCSVVLVILLKELLAKYGHQRVLEEAFFSGIESSQDDIENGFFLHDKDYTDLSHKLAFDRMDAHA